MSWDPVYKLVETNSGAAGLLLMGQPRPRPFAIYGGGAEDRAGRALAATPSGEEGFRGNPRGGRSRRKLLIPEQTYASLPEKTLLESEGVKIVEFSRGFLRSMGGRRKARGKKAKRRRALGRGKTR